MVFADDERKANPTGFKFLQMAHAWKENLAKAAVPVPVPSDVSDHEERDVDMPGADKSGSEGDSDNDA